MFLDDKLYNCVMQTKIESPADFKQMMNNLFAICEDHYKPELTPKMSYKEGRVLMDRVFKSWDLMVARLKKEKYFMVDLLEKYTFKDAYLKNEQLRAIYEQGK